MQNKLALALCFAAFPAFAEAPCNYETETTTQYQGVIESTKLEQRQVFPYVDDTRKCNVVIQAKLKDKYLGKGFPHAPHGKLKVYSYWHFMEHEFDHAGFVETSLMLAISHKVRMKKAKKGLIMENLSKLEQSAAKKLSTEWGGFPQVAKNGVWGDPTKATKKDGKKFLTEIVRNLAKECQS